MIKRVDKGDFVKVRIVLVNILGRDVLAIIGNVFSKPGAYKAN